MIGPGQQDIGPKMLLLVSAKRAGDHDRPKGKFHDLGGDIAPVPLAPDDEYLAFLDPDWHGGTSTGDIEPKQGGRFLAVGKIRATNASSTPKAFGNIAQLVTAEQPVIRPE